jgi:threonyl-tRNA synthetase
MYAHRARSYRELPIRFAEFGVLHRNELTGALHGLTRVRRFQQDDSHIFCRQDQIESEVAGVLDLIKYTYGVFGFNFKMELSTMPEDHMGEVALWQRAEEQLKRVLDKLQLPWKLNPGDGAFYGPKIDIHIQDALKRMHQCATIQLDFQLPLRFELKYMSADGALLDTPVMIHRAVFGSIERFLAVLIEHTAGKWPFWISPRQAIVVPVSDKYFDYARLVASRVHAAHFFVDVDDSDRKLQKKVREAQLAQYNYILVVGQEEAESNTVNVRLRDGNDVIGKLSIDELLQRLEQLRREHK